MSQHTPGPWTIENKGVILGSEDFPIAYMAFTSGEIDEANARLIAAAPEMLDILIAFVHDADKMGCDHEPAPEECYICQARALLAKVEANGGKPSHPRGPAMGRLLPKSGISGGQV